MADPVEQRRQALAMNEAAAAAWAEAVRAHILAPPDAGFADRLHRFAEAAGVRGRAARVADAAGMKWVAQPAARNSQPPYELRPGTGRVGPAELWARFDECVAAYNTAVAGTSAGAVADAADAIAELVEELARAVEVERGEAAPERRGRGSSRRS
jgi:hypothetical protein